jgi:hypothetical protein
VRLSDKAPSESCLARVRLQLMELKVKVIKQDICNTEIQSTRGNYPFNLSFHIIAVSYILWSIKQPLTQGPGAVAHACNPSNQGDEIMRISVQGQPGQKVRPYLTSNIR